MVLTQGFESRNQFRDEPGETGPEEISTEIYRGEPCPACRQAGLGTIKRISPSWGIFSF